MSLNDDIARLRTMTVPLQVRYFAENGLVAKAGVNFVSQQVEERLEPFFDQTRENFVTVDLGVGFRLPKRRGSVSLEVPREESALSSKHSTRGPW